MSLSSVFRPGLFSGKVALVSGGGSGIGLRTARELRALGANVMIAARNADRLQQAANYINSVDEPGFSPLGRVEYVRCNIREEESVIAAVRATVEKFGRLDYLVNNAGGQFPSPADSISAKGFRAVIDTNLTGTFLASKAAFNEVFQDCGHGVIVNVIANMWNGFPNMSHTGAARSGVENLTKSLSTEWGRYGVRVNSVAPGPIHSSGIATYPEATQNHFLNEVPKMNQASRLGTEEEVASAIIYLLSPAAQFITGETLKVDGGESIYHPYMPPEGSIDKPWPAHKDSKEPNHGIKSSL